MFRLADARLVWVMHRLCCRMSGLHIKIRQVWQHWIILNWDSAMKIDIFQHTLFDSWQYMGIFFAILHLPTKAGTFSAELNYFGYSSYNESKIGIGFGKQLFDKLSVGIQLDYLNNYIADMYGNAGNVAAEVGVLAEPVENFFIGAHIFNPTKSKIADYNEERIPTILKFGMGYKFSDKLMISGETEKDLDYRPSYKAGVEFMVRENVYLRTGIMVVNSREYTNSVQSCFGLGYVLSSFHADLAFSTDPILGITPHVSISYRFKHSDSENE